MPPKFDIQFKNTSDTVQTVPLFAPADNTSKRAFQDRFNLPFVENYTPGTIFKIKIGSTFYSIELQRSATFKEVIEALSSISGKRFKFLYSDSVNGNVFDVFSPEGATQLCVGTPPVVSSAETTSDGTQIEVTFDKAMADPSGKEDEFTYKIDGVENIFDAAALKVGDNTTIVLNCDTTIEEEQVISLSYIKGTVKSSENDFLNSFTDYAVSNLVSGAFIIGTAFDSFVYLNSLLVQSDKKIVAGGNFTSYNGDTRNYIIRLNSDGSIDNTFDIGTGFNDYVRAISIQGDGKILVGGNFNSYNGTTSNRLSRLNTDGSIDVDFTNNVGTAGLPSCIVVQPVDGKIIVGGNFSSWNGSPSSRIVRLKTDGSIDSSFVVGSGFNNHVNSVIIQPTDGKIIVGGLFTGYNGTAVNRIIRLNTDGSIDNTFVIGTGFNDTVISLAIQEDGKILVGGSFTDYNGTFCSHIIRLNSDGSVDSSFSTEVLLFAVNAIVLQPDNKILICGSYKLIRLNADGSTDNTFNSSDFDSIVYAMALQGGKILAGGSFSYYNSNQRNNIIRINADGSDNTEN